MRHGIVNSRMVLNLHLPLDKKTAHPIVARDDWSIGLRGAEMEVRYAAIQSMHQLLPQRILPSNAKETKKGRLWRNITLIFFTFNSTIAREHFHQRPS